MWELSWRPEIRSTVQSTNKAPLGEYTPEYGRVLAESNGLIDYEKVDARERRQMSVNSGQTDTLSAK